MTRDNGMDLSSLTLLVDIIDCGNLSCAARKLKMSRANVSYRLAQLERSLGLQVVRRTTRRVEPTEIGLRLYEHGRAIRQELLAAEDAVASLGHGLRGSLRVSLPTGFGQLVMSGWFIEFKQRYPDIALEVVFDNRVEDLLREDVDLAVRVMSEPPPGMVARELGEVRFVVCASAGYAAGNGMPATPAQLLRQPLVTSTLSGRTLRVVACRGSERETFALHPKLASENFQFLREAILAGVGVGLVPDYVVGPELAQGEVVTALDDWRLSVAGTRLYLLRMPDRYQTVAVRTLIDFIVARTRGWSQAAVAASESAPHAAAELLPA
jgi:DNA-binding transcriptional LysR family regulator